MINISIFSCENFSLGEAEKDSKMEAQNAAQSPDEKPYWDDASANAAAIAEDMKKPNFDGDEKRVVAVQKDLKKIHEITKNAHKKEILENVNLPLIQMLYDFVIRSKDMKKEFELYYHIKNFAIKLMNSPQCKCA